MPWDDTNLFVAEVNNDGELTDNKKLSGNGEAVCQPVWSPDNTLYLISDRNNWWNIYRYQHDKLKCIYLMNAEFAVPQWSFREACYGFINTDQLAAIYRQQGIACVGLINASNSRLEKIEMEYTDFESIVCAQNKIWFIAASPKHFPAIIEYDLKQKKNRILRSSNRLQIDKKFIAIGKPLKFPVDDSNYAYAFFYEPTNKAFCGLANETPPLIVMSHGGPTGESHNGLKMTIQFFTSRGFAVLDVNYGGSSGYGRKYRQRLNKQWGVVDVNDCSKAALFVSDQGWADKDRLAIRGGSAGGFTTLAALAFNDIFKAGASHYGVSDLEALARETHKFESRYLDSLIGKYPKEQSLYRDRSPIHAVDNLSCPVIFFQGLEDKIVLPDQAEMMVAALKRKGIPVAYIAYKGEQHGFRRLENIKRTLEAELYFYSVVFNFECADEIAPVNFL